MIALANTWKTPLLQAIADYLGGLDSGRVHTFKSNITVTSAVALATYVAAESNFAGYSEFVLSLHTPFLNGSNQAEMDFDAVTFSRSGTSGGAQNIYGYFVTNGDNDTLWWAESLSVPKNMDAVGATWILAPRLLLDNLS